MTTIKVKDGRESVTEIGRRGAFLKGRMPGGRILIFARYPVAGKTKTRLIPALGPEKAARLHRRMTEHVVAAARKVKLSEGPPRPLKIVVLYTGASRKRFGAWLGTDLDYLPQPEGEIGVRMREAFRHAFKNGPTSTVLIGSDLPGLTPDILLRALDTLQHADVVLGKAHDGGYYLIGMRRHYPNIFEGMNWGTDRVYEQTADHIKRLGLHFKDLPSLGDVDRPKDLSPLREDERFRDVFTGKPRISVIIPTLNEAQRIGGLLDRLHRAEAVECIVADGGSRDHTCRVARRAGGRVLVVAGGRAMQQNAGAHAAGGRILLFLHADTVPPDGFDRMISKALDRPDTVAGAFRFQTDGCGMKMRLVAWITNVRSTLFECPYGDQGLFMEKRVFEEMGGFAPLPIMEDFELVRRLGHRGNIVTLPHAAITSARRWRELGVIRTTAINQLMILGFLAGIHVENLARLYRNRWQEDLGWSLSKRND